MSNKIGWCDMTWNPVWGCKNHCEYCYARGIAKRFWKQMHKFEYHYAVKNPLCYVWTDEYLSGLEDFKPTFLDSQFNKELPKKPQRIFVGSMSEIRYWELNWILDVLKKVEQYPQHTFQFLTKFPQVYLNFDFPKNCWLGMTITKNDDFFKGTYNFIFPKNNETNRHNIKYISFEPLLGKVLDLEVLKYFNWVIIGAETGNRKGKVIPNLEWVSNIVNYCRKDNISVYIKDSIKGFYPIGIKEFPKVVK